MKLSVIGAGYLGATNVACMAEMGHEVVGVDVDENKNNQLVDGAVPFHGSGVPEIMRCNLDIGRLRFSTDYAAGTNIHFIGVGNPQEHADALAGPGTIIELVRNPEFLRESHGVEDTIHPDRIVVSLREGSNAEPVLREASGAEVTLLADATGHDERIGRKFLGAGLGFGGGCLPKDIRAFMARAGELGADQALSFLREVDSINMRQRDRMVHFAKEDLGGSVMGRRITVLGAAFKANSDDVRDSPALNIADQLSLSGSAVSVYDPQAMDNAKKIFPTLDYAESLQDALAGAELVILATEWQQFRQMDPVGCGELVATKRIIDGRNVLDVDAWQAAGWSIRAPGRFLGANHNNRSKERGEYFVRMAR